MSTPREQADITQVEKKGDLYKVSGVSKGKKCSFYVDAHTIDSLPSSQAKDLMKRNIHNLATDGEGR